MHQRAWATAPSYEVDAYTVLPVLDHHRLRTRAVVTAANHDATNLCPRQ